MVASIRPVLENVKIWKHPYHASNGVAELSLWLIGNSSSMGLEACVERENEIPYYFETLYYYNVEMYTAKC